MHITFIKGRYARRQVFVKDHYRRNWRPVKRMPRKWWKLQRAWKVSRPSAEAANLFT
jgi:hypothetical protein